MDGLSRREQWENRVCRTTFWVSKSHETLKLTDLVSSGINDRLHIRLHRTRL